MVSQKSVAKTDYVENCHSGAIATPAFDHRLHFKKGLVPSLQVLYGLEDFFLVHGVHFDAFPDTLNEGDGKLSAKMFAELLETFQNRAVPTLAIGVKQIVIEMEA